MCIVVRDIEPKIAKEDLVVIKCLHKTPNGKFETPYRNMVVQFNKVLRPFQREPEIYSIHWTDELKEIHGGVFHALLTYDTSYLHSRNDVFFEAIIPKGTEYWLDTLCHEICATQMIITDKKATKKSIKINFLKTILQDAPVTYGGLRVGDWVMNDNSVIHPNGRISKKNVKAIVCGFDMHRPICCATDKLYVYNFDKNAGYGTFNNMPVIDAEKDFNGQGYMQQYKRSKLSQKKERFEAYEACLNYRLDHLGENWHLGSLGETKTMLENALYVNASFKILNDYVINSYESYMTSNESGENIFVCDVNTRYVVNCIAFKKSYGKQYCIIPFLNGSITYKG